MFDSSVVKAAWEKYVATGTKIPKQIEGVNQDIVDSWRRSQSYLDPFSQDLPCLSSKEVKKRQEQNAVLLKIAYPYLIQFYECLAGTGHQFMLTDKDGCQLKVIKEGNTLESMSEEKGFVDGKLYSERDMGTNGIGTALALEKPIMIRGPEHYHKLFDNVCCYGSPIYDPITHELIGCINIAGPLENYDPMIMAMLKAAILGIEKEFELTKLSNILDSISYNNTSGILLVNQNGDIIHFNKSVLHLLKLEESDVAGHNVNDLVFPGTIPNIWEEVETAVSNYEYTFLNKNGISLDLCVTVIPRKTDIQSFSATLIKLDSQDYIHRLTNQMAGFFASYTFDSFIGKSNALSHVKDLGRIASGFDNPVLIVGERGTGKEMLAQAIHNESARKDGPFITVSCATVPKAKLDDDLWGYEGNPHILGKENGNPGKIELADGGTLLLRDIGNMPLETQARLVRFLKTKQFTRAGGEHVKVSDIRIISITTTNLQQLVEKNMFRSDLYYLLSSFSITIPPLRERPEDISALCQKYAEQYNTSGEPITFDKESAEAIIGYAWTGNMRQLESVIEGAVNVAKKSVVRLSNLPLDIINDYYAGRQKLLFTAKEEAVNEKYMRMEIKEYNQLMYAIKKAEGNVKEASKVLSMPLSTLYRKLAKYEIEPKDYKN